MSRRRKTEGANIAISRSQVIAILVAGWAVLFVCCGVLSAKQQVPDWQDRVRELVKAQQLETAIKVVDDRLLAAPGDVEAEGWRARLLTWMGRLPEAEAEYRQALDTAADDTDLLEGLAGVLARQQRFEEALPLLSRAIQVDPRRSDVVLARGRVLRTLGRRREAREDFAAAIYLDPSSREARAGLTSLRPEPRHELRIGSDTDWFNYADANQGQSVSLASRWSPHWSTSLAGTFFQRAGFSADKGAFTLTGRSMHWGALTFGGAAAHDEGIVPRREGFFEYGRGWRVSERGFLRGVEASGGPHWFWYSTARILTVSGATLVYLPREFSWSVALTGARSRFSGVPAEWRPSGATRLNFPLAGSGERRFTGNVFFAAGTESFANVDQLGRFSSHTYGGGFRLRFTAAQDVAASAGYQKRTQGRTDTVFGFSYGIRF
ncbi:MAG TPA: tetratricopeptide repeat protein [Candidatus Acidoferrales bacterium]|nr:tetratricopeptide repeat protein [Candidatus Acidoferrales bacterium]